ncbi:MAG TPA: 50S ribosomal protein L18e [Thermoplasmata archaeon]|nr:50S ribosomal protein L18e [Thermoplasmata archaeon]
MGTTVKTNPALSRLIDELKAVSRAQGTVFWRDIAERLSRRRQHWSEVNLSRVSRTAKEGETVVVPGVLLGSGELTKPVTIATYRASAGARAKVERAGGKVLGLRDLAASNPKGSGVRIVG